jgi:hypothetical protein
MHVKAVQFVPIVICMALAISSATSADELLINRDSGSSLSSGPGIVGKAGDSWNQSSGGSGWDPIADYQVFPLVDSSGTVLTGVTLEIDLVGNPPFNPEAGNLAGVGSGKGPSSNSSPFDFSLSNVPGFVLTLTVSGLEDTHFDVYAFWAYGPDVGTTASVNGSPTQSFIPATATADPVQGRDYLRFERISPIAGEITISLPTVDTNSGVSGFQIQRLSPAAMMLIVS